MRCLAAIDVGTNTALLTIARVDEHGSLEILEQRALITRLGRGVDAEGRLDKERIHRALEALGELRTAADRHGADVVAVGTSALRDARNAKDFLQPAARVLGAPVEVISGEREAALTFAGALHGLPELPGKRACVVDIGGGSTEIVCGSHGKLDASVSLNIGSVRLHERHGLQAPTDMRSLQILEAEIADALQQSPVQPRPPLVAIAGTATTLAALHLEMEPYDPARIHGMRLSRRQLRSLRDRLAPMSIERRCALPGLEPGRADVIVTGATLLCGIVEHAGAEETFISDGGVRIGLLLERFASLAPDP